jgi:hypothetical protein
LIREKKDNRICPLNSDNDPVNLHWKNCKNPSKSFGYGLLINNNYIGIEIKKNKNEFYKKRHGIRKKTSLFNQRILGEKYILEK